MKPMIARFVVVACGLLLANGLYAAQPLPPEKLEAKAKETKPGLPLDLELTWKNKATHADEISVERSDDGGLTFPVVKSILPSATTYSDVDKNLSEGKTYYYRLRVHDTVAGTGVYSDYTPLVAVNTAHPHLRLVVSKGAMGDQKQDSNVYRILMLEDGVGDIEVRTDIYDNRKNYDPSAVNGLDVLRYRISITPKSGGARTATYSLLTLGVQADEHAIRIEEMEVAGTNATAVFYPSEKAATKIEQSDLPVIVPAAGFDADPKQPWLKTPHADNIWLISLTNATSCQLWVEIADGKNHPLRIGHIAWSGDSYSESHDNEPPTDPN